MLISSVLLAWKLTWLRIFPGQRSLTESVQCPYQGLFVDFWFPGRITKDTDGAVIESNQKDIEGLNGETA